MGKIIIMNTGLEINVDKNQLVNCEQTPDGLNFSFKDGSNYYVLATYMKLETKERIIHSTNIFEQGKLIINLADYKNPVRIDFT